MCSPVGHSLIGLLVVSCYPNQTEFVNYKSWDSTKITWLLLIMFAANAADLDFLAGWLMGDMNQYHHAMSHSLFASLLFGSLCAGVAVLLHRPVWPIAVLGVLVYLSHLVADLITADPSPPYGMQLFWPVSREYFDFSVKVFNPIGHGNVGDSVATVFARIFSSQNAIAVMFEIIIVAPLLAVNIYWQARQRTK